MRWQPGSAHAVLAARSSGLRRMLVVLRPYRASFLMSVGFGLVNAGLGVAAPVYAAYIVARALEGATPSDLWPIVGILALIVVGRAIANWLEAWTSHELTFRLLAEVRQWLYEAFERLAPNGLAGRRSGDLVAAAMSDSEALEIFYAHTMINVIVGVVVPIVAVGVMVAIHPLLAVVLVPWLIAMTVFPLWHRKRNRSQGADLRARIADANSAMVDSVQGLREVTGFGQEAAQLAVIERESASVGRAQRVLGTRSSGELSVAQVVTWCGVLAVLVAGGWLLERGSLAETGYLVAVVLAVQSFSPIAQMLNNTRITGVTNAAAKRVFDLVTAPTAVPDDGTQVAAPPTAEVRFESVSFRYGTGQPLVLDDVSFAIPNGRTAALVGHSGAGKSTCAHLLLRFADPQGGRITIGGIDIRDLTQTALRNLIAYVPQDTYLFNLPLGENLRLGTPDASDDAVRAAAAAAQAAGFISAMPLQYATVVGERGARLSGGERQRIAIARALLRESPLLVLDESVSMLDAVSERALQQAVARARERRTALVIAHRLSTIRSADTVIVLERGRVVDHGPHEVLMERCAAYQELVRAQWPEHAAIGPEADTEIQGKEVTPR